MSSSEPARPPTLPGTPGPLLEALYGLLSPLEQSAVVEHLTGGTSAEWLASTLTAHGHAISASTIRSYRRSLEGSVQV